MQTSFSILEAIDALQRVYRDPDYPVAPVLSKEQHVKFENDAFDFGFIPQENRAPLPVIVGAGSDDRTDWLKNIFLLFETELRGRMLSWLEEHRLRGQKVYLLGHSRAGAMAQLLAKYFKDLNYIEPVVITFGCPMIKNYKNHRGLYEHYRFINRGDPIPKQPSFWYPLGWGSGHAVPPIEIGERADTWKERFLIYGGLTEHKMHDYRADYLRSLDRKEVPLCI